MASDSYSEKIDFVDDFSMKIEELGHPRIYGQILGWLLICDPSHQSFPDLMENLDISKASVSNTTRMLLERGLIEKVRVKGERQIYFKLKEGSLVDFMERQLQLSLDLEEITQRGLQFIDKEGSTDPARLKRAHHFHQVISRQTKDLIEKYKTDNNL